MLAIGAFLQVRSTSAFAAGDDFLGSACLWPAASFLTLAAAYFRFGPVILGKRPDGRLAWWSWPLYGPVILVNTAIWRVGAFVSGENAVDRLTDEIRVGRRLRPDELPGDVRSVVDLTAEFPEPRRIVAAVNYLARPLLDGCGADPETLATIARDVLAAEKPVLIHCAQGHGRTGMVAASALLVSGSAPDADRALAAVGRARPGTKLNGEQRNAVRRLAESLATPAASRRAGRRLQCEGS